MNIEGWCLQTWNQLFNCDSASFEISTITDGGYSLNVGDEKISVSIGLTSKEVLCFARNILKTYYDSEREVLSNHELFELADQLRQDVFGENQEKE